MRILQTICFILLAQFVNAQTQGVNNTQTKLRVNQLRWTPTDATNDSVYIIRGHTTTGEPAWYKVKIGGATPQDTTLQGDVVGGINSTFVRKINGVTVENKTPQGREVLQYNGTQWTPDSIDLADLPTLAQSVLLGRTSASTGSPQAITLGTGLSMSGTVLSNSAPNQTVSLTQGTGITVSGTYPNFTVTNSAPDQTVTISGATGTYPNFTVAPTTPGGSSGQVQYNNAGAFGALDSFTVVANPDRVGIGVPTPTARLDIQGSGNTSATNALRVRNSSGLEILSVRNDNRVYIGNPTTGQANAIISGDINTMQTLMFGANGTIYNGIGVHANNGTFDFATNGSFNFKNISGTGIPSTSFTNTPYLVITSNRMINSINTSASNPSFSLTGTGFSGGTSTTTKPTLLIEPTGTTSTGWSTSGTKLGVNAESGFTGELINAQINGTTRFSINPLGSGFHGVMVGNQFTFTHSSSTNAGLRITTNGSGKSYIDGWSDGASKPANYDIIIGSRVNNTTNSITGSTTAENGSNVQIGFDATSNPRSLLSLNTVTRGFLPPRLTTAQRNAVTWVAGDAGMIIYCTDCTATDASTGVSQTWNGTTWKNHY